MRADDSWTPLATAMVESRDELRAVLPEFNEVQRIIGGDVDKLAHLDKIRGAVLASINRLRLALKGRA